MKDLLTELMVGALDAVDPRRLVSRATAGWDPVGQRVAVIAIGKAALGMLSGARATLDVADVVAVAPDCGGDPDCLVGSHPVPDRSSEVAGRAVLDLARACGPDTSVLVLISGGASALCEVPIPGIELDEVLELGDRLLRCGAPIGAVNEVRSGLSAFKAGGLGGALSRAGEVRVLALSDVVGSPPEVIGSGPTVARPFDPEATIEVAERCGAGVPEGLAAALREVRAPIRASFPVEVLADGLRLAEAVVEAARARGLEARVGEVLEGEAREVARRVAEQDQPGLTVHAGETTVRVVGDAPGGRNQEGALAAAAVIAGTDAIFLALGSDGIDGTTDAAGAVVDGGTWTSIGALGLDPAEMLDANDAHRALDAVGDLVRIGPTGTNVADIWAVWR